MWLKNMKQILGQMMGVIWNIYFFSFVVFKITNIVSAEYLVNNIYIFSFFFSGFKITNIVSM